MECRLRVHVLEIKKKTKKHTFCFWPEHISMLAGIDKNCFEADGILKYRSGP